MKHLLVLLSFIRTAIISDLIPIDRVDAEHYLRPSRWRWASDLLHRDPTAEGASSSSPPCPPLGLHPLSSSRDDLRDPVEPTTTPLNFDDDPTSPMSCSSFHRRDLTKKIPRASYPPSSFPTSYDLSASTDQPPLIVCLDKELSRRLVDLTDCHGSSVNERKGDEPGKEDG